MALIRIISLWILLAGLPITGFCAQQLPEQPATKDSKARTEAKALKGEEHGISQKASEIGRIKTPLGPFLITNSMVVTWVVAICLIVFAQLATQNMKDIPDGAQNFWEWMVESLNNFLEGIIGHHLVQRTFWFFATVFIFILFSNWYMTLAMALVFFLCWIVWAIREVGPLGFLLHLFAPKGDTTGALKVLMVVVFFVVGLLEVFSILFRPVSLSFRLYGNIFAGENMLEAMSKLVPHFGWLLPIPFYFMELLVGFVQALVFMLLTAVFTMLICEHEEGHETAHH